MLAEIEQFVNWVHRRNPEARTWKDYGYDLHFFLQVVGDRTPTKSPSATSINSLPVNASEGSKPPPSIVVWPRSWRFIFFSPMKTAI